MNDPEKCQHDTKILCRMQHSNGVWVAVYQCTACWKNCGQTNKNKIWQAFSTLPLFDREKRDAYWKAQSEAWRLAHEQRREEESAEFWRRHKAVMESPEWAAKRKKVFARCRGICEGCGERSAAHVHHLTYARLGCEMLFDLAGICKPCHDLIHNRDTSPGSNEISFTSRG